jgi:hypothetical protein
LVGLTAVPHELVNLQIDDLPEISMITASKLYVRGAVNGMCCSCKGGCKTKQCACKKIKFSAQQSVIKTPGVVKIWRIKIKVV